MAYTYNAQHELRTAIDQNATAHAYTRDVLGRVVADVATVASTPPSSQDAVDTRVTEIDAAYNNAGLLTDVRSKGLGGGGGSTPVTVDHVRYGYDALQRVISITQQPDGDIDSDHYLTHTPRTVGYEYDTRAFSTSGTGNCNRSRVSALDYPANPMLYPDVPAVLEYHYDGFNESIVSLAPSASRLTGLTLKDGDGGGLGTGATTQIAAYDYAGLSMLAHEDLVQADVALDRTVDAYGRRRYGSGTGAITSQAAATYPGYDRFGRVKRQAWVRGGYDWNGSSESPAPNSREHVNLAYGYDKVGNPIARQQAQQGAGYGGWWADRDFEYHYDGLDRLTLARKGVLNVPGPGFGGTFPGDPNSSSSIDRPQIPSGVGSDPDQRAYGSQQWTLDALGNWNGFGADVGTGGGPVAAFDGSGGVGSQQSRSHTHSNELGGITAAMVTPPTGAEFVAAPMLQPMAYVHDDAGNRVASDGTAGGTVTGPKNKYVYDAWNRLVRIDKWDDTSSAYVLLARYDYNGMHWRTRKLEPLPSYTGIYREHNYIYNASWQAIVEEIDDDYNLLDPSYAGPEHVVQQVFGIGGINDALYRRSGESSSASDYNQLDSGDGASFFDKSFYQLSDAQGSIVSVISAEPMQFSSGLTVNTARTLETIDYDPYGRSRRSGMQDLAHTGVADQSGSDSIFWSAMSAGSPAADANDDGVVDSQDSTDFYYANWSAPTDTTPPDALSADWIGNTYGYCGYYADTETLGINGNLNGFLYHCRHREYDPIAGRWLQRDPAGFIDGMNLYQYCRGFAAHGVDPFGLDWFDTVVNWGAGFGDVVTFGATNAVREATGLNDAVDKNSTAYAVGEATGAVTVGAVTGGAAAGAVGAETAATVAGAMFVGGMGAVAADTAQQANDIQNGKQAGYDPVRGVTAGVVGATFGGLLQGAVNLVRAAIGAATGALGGEVGAGAGGEGGGATDGVTDRLRQLAKQAKDIFDQQGFTDPQKAAIGRNPNLEPAFRGERMDTIWKKLVGNDPELPPGLQITPRFVKGPDVIDPETGQWWDLTTPGQWPAHLDKYGPNGTPIFYGGGGCGGGGG